MIFNTITKMQPLVYCNILISRVDLASGKQLPRKAIIRERQFLDNILLKILDLQLTIIIIECQWVSDFFFSEDG